MNTLEMRLDWPPTANGTAPPIATSPAAAQKAQMVRGSRVQVDLTSGILDKGPG
jgi:hypothetical protein